MEMDFFEAKANKMDVLEEVLLQEKAQKMQQVLNHLPDMQKEVILFRFYHDRKIKDIAAITGVSLSTAKSRLLQGLQKVKRYLEEEQL